RAGYADVHSPWLHAGRGGLSAFSECRAVSEAAGGNGAVIRGVAGSGGAGGGGRRAGAGVFARSAQIPISARGGAAGQDADGAHVRSDVAGGGGAISRRRAGEGPPADRT